MSEPDLPGERLSGNVRWLWRTEGLIATAVVLVGGQAIANAALDGRLAALLGVLPAIVVGLVGIGLVPELRWRIWRVALDDERLDLRHGAITVRRTLVPMRRVQHVDSAAGVLERLFDVATVTVHTAGGEVEVPGLHDVRAAQLARRIAELARVDDD